MKGGGGERGGGGGGLGQFIAVGHPSMIWLVGKGGHSTAILPFTALAIDTFPLLLASCISVSVVVDGSIAIALVGM